MKFGELGQIFDGPHATPKRVTEGPYFLNIASLTQGRLDLSQSDHITPEQFKQWTKRVTPQAGDLLFSYETRLGEAALMPEGISACLGRRMALLRPNRRIVEPKFLLYWYLAPSMQEMIRKQLVMGATVPRILLSEMPNWTVEIPPLVQQQAIAELLGALDDKIAINKSLASQLAVLAQTKFSVVSAVTRQVAALSNVVDTQYGITASAAETGDFRILRVTDINKKPWITWDSVPYTATPSPADLSKYLLQPEDILIARMADPGKVAFVEEGDPPTVFASYLIRIRPVSEIPPLYLFHYFRSREYQDYVAANASGSVQKNLNAKRIVQADIPLASLESMRTFEAEVRETHKLMNHTIRESRTLAQLRDALLPALMDGRLHISDAIEQVEGVL